MQFKDMILLISGLYFLGLMFGLIPFCVIKGKINNWDDDYRDQVCVQYLLTYFIPTYVASLIFSTLGFAVGLDYGKDEKSEIIESKKQISKKLREYTCELKDLLREVNESKQRNTKLAENLEESKNKNKCLMKNIEDKEKRLNDRAKMLQTGLKDVYNTFFNSVKKTSSIKRKLGMQGVDNMPNKKEVVSKQQKKSLQNSKTSLFQQVLDKNDKNIKICGNIEILVGTHYNQLEEIKENIPSLLNKNSK